ncbi:hypothetical protein DFH29DRAFT_876608 [Suillus ampliporus]|nr:hypothetical protein DFH29DRAFT_876608 [Suillus ampliporus]
MIQRRSISELYMANADHLVEEGLFKGKILVWYYYRYHFCTIGNQSDEGNPHDRQLQAYLQQLAGRFRTVALIYIHEESTLSPGLAFGSRKLEHPLGLLEVENHTFTVSVYDPSAATSPDSPSSR